MFKKSTAIGIFISRSGRHLTLVYFIRTITGLPDDAAKEAASWVEAGNDRTVLIDASTAFRVNEDWAYGFPGKSLSPSSLRANSLIGGYMRYLIVGWYGFLSLTLFFQ
jgi:hypothetical protein